MGENITTRGIDLLQLPTGARLHLGGQAVVELTGLRNPCSQIEKFQPGLMAAVLDRDAQGRVVRKAGVMAVVLQGGQVQPGDTIAVQLPAAPPARSRRSEGAGGRGRQRLPQRPVRGRSRRRRSW